MKRFNISYSPQTSKRLRSSPECLTDTLPVLDGSDVEDGGEDAIGEEVDYAVGTHANKFVADVGGIASDSEEDDMIEYVGSLSETSTSTKYAWSDAASKLLIANVNELLPKVGKSQELKTKSKMWATVSEIMKSKGYMYTPLQIENKFRSLERGYKKTRDHNNKTERNRLTCSDEHEVTDFLGDRSSVSSRFVLGQEERRERDISPPENPKSARANAISAAVGAHPNEFVADVGGVGGIASDSEEDDMIEYVGSVSETSTSTKYAWSDAASKLLIANVNELLPKVGKSQELKTKSKMWATVSEILKSKGYMYTPLQIENKFRSLERGYKKTGDLNRLTCSDEHEVTDLLGDRPSVSPKFLLGQEDRKERDIAPPEAPKSAGDREYKVVAPPENPKSARDKESRNAILVQFRLNREQREEHFKALKESLDKQNQLIAERNKILREMLKIAYISEAGRFMASKP